MTTPLFLGGLIMAKKSTKSVKTNNDAKILRNYDIYSMEKRVYDMDNSPRRSYDLYSLEQRIYDLEQGGGPTPPTPVPTVTDEIKRIVGDSNSGSATIKYTGKYVIWIILDSTFIDTYGFKINGVDATSTLASGVLTHVSISQGFGYTEIETELNEGDVFSWNVQHSNRYFIMFNKVEE